LKIGIPRALLYYHYFPLWESFWRNLGLEVVVSSVTDKQILDFGVAIAVPEACLPVKICYGHIMTLANKVDYLFLPRLISAQRGTYICPKFMGLPDMIKHCGQHLPPIIAPPLNARAKKRSWEQSHLEAAQQLGIGRSLARSAWQKAQQDLKRYHKELQSGRTPIDILYERQPSEQGAGRTLLLLGHPYNIFDEFVSMKLINRLYQRGYRVITPEMLPPHIVQKEAARLPKHLFWSLGRLLVGTANYYLKKESIAGIIHVVSFGCGPDSLVGELLERRTKRLSQKPFLLLTLDEHTGEGGLVTRLEAFLDMIEWRHVS
jgi:predicted nucleotide-binding protein (sugar kinase/HSP70/actin superfamily)